MGNSSQSAVEQLVAFGLDVGTPVIGQLKRCKIVGGEMGGLVGEKEPHKRRGWYHLHEVVTQNGVGSLVFGSYGCFVGAENFCRKITLNRKALSKEQSDAIRLKIAADQKALAEKTKREHARCSIRATKAWEKCAFTATHEYLTAKHVQSHGLRTTPSGSLAIPVEDSAGRLWGLQVIRTKAGQKNHHAKEFWPVGMCKKGNFFAIGSVRDVVLVAEGYATAATLYEATGLPVVVAFDATNLTPVGKAIRKRYPSATIIFCADDDRYQTCQACKKITTTQIEKCAACGEDHQAKNAGAGLAGTAALAVNGQMIVPTFADEQWRLAARERGQKITDFNDLARLEGTAAVRRQIERALPKPELSSELNGGGGDEIKPFDDSGELHKRFSLIYGMSGTVFDHQERILLSLTDMRDACKNKYVYRDWAESPDRSIVRQAEVGFDPGQTDPQIKCNLWGGWPTKPKRGNCDHLLGLLEHLCSNSDPEFYYWVLKWLAWPLQNPGAKLKTTLVVHGPEGTGKNLFFEAMMAIYGRYGRIIDQAAIEDKFNDWASKKLFMVADEVLARSELWHVKNKLKSLISGDWIRINPKNVASYEERNHCNFVFLSNETMPVILSEDDRRYAVVWTPKKLAMSYYHSALAEIKSGGIEALYDHLLQINLSDFDPGAPPPITEAKKDLIALSMDSTSRFFTELDSGDIGRVRLVPCLSNDFYDLYKAWCVRTGQRAAAQNRLVEAVKKKHDMSVLRKRYTLGSAPQGPHCVLMPDKIYPPEGESESDWLGTSIESFKRQIDAYKGATGG